MNSKTNNKANNKTGSGANNYLRPTITDSFAGDYIGQNNLENSSENNSQNKNSLGFKTSPQVMVLDKNFYKNDSRNDSKNNLKPDFGLQNGKKIIKKNQTKLLPNNIENNIENSSEKRSQKNGNQTGGEPGFIKKLRQQLGQQFAGVLGKKPSVYNLNNRKQKVQEFANSLSNSLTNSNLDQDIAENTNSNLTASAKQAFINMAGTTSAVLGVDNQTIIQGNQNKTDSNFFDTLKQINEAHSGTKPANEPSVINIKNITQNPAGVVFGNGLQNSKNQNQTNPVTFQNQFEGFKKELSNNSNPNSNLNSSLNTNSNLKTQYPGLIQDMTTGESLFGLPLTLAGGSFDNNLGNNFGNSGFDTPNSFGSEFEGSFDTNFDNNTLSNFNISTNNSDTITGEGFGQENQKSSKIKVQADISTTIPVNMGTKSKDNTELSTGQKPAITTIPTIIPTTIATATPTIIADLTNTNNNQNKVQTKPQTKPEINPQIEQTNQIKNSSVIKINSNQNLNQNPALTPIPTTTEMVQPRILLRNSINAEQKKEVQKQQIIEKSRQRQGAMKQVFLAPIVANLATGDKIAINANVAGSKTDVISTCLYRLDKLMELRSKNVHHSIENEINELKEFLYNNPELDLEHGAGTTVELKRQIHSLQTSLTRDLSEMERYQTFLIQKANFYLNFHGNLVDNQELLIAREKNRFNRDIWPRMIKAGFNKLETLDQFGMVKISVYLQKELKKEELASPTTNQNENIDTNQVGKAEAQENSQNIFVNLVQSQPTGDIEVNLTENLEVANTEPENTDAKKTEVDSLELENVDLGLVGGIEGMDSNQDEASPANLEMEFETDQENKSETENQENIDNNLQDDTNIKSKILVQNLDETGLDMNLEARLEQERISLEQEKLAKEKALEKASEEAKRMEQEKLAKEKAENEAKKQAEEAKLASQKISMEVEDRIAKLRDLMHRRAMMKALSYVKFELRKPINNDELEKLQKFIDQYLVDARAKGSEAERVQITIPYEGRMHEVYVPAKLKNKTAADLALAFCRRLNEYLDVIMLPESAGKTEIFRLIKNTPDEVVSASPLESIAMTARL